MITVIVPAFNATGTLGAAIASIQAQIEVQTAILVVDDGSTDGTAALAARLGAEIRVLRKENGGAATARNAGVAAADTDLLAFLDADDAWPPGSLSLLLERLEERPEHAMALGRTQLVRAASESSSAPELLPHGAPWHAPVFGCGLFRRSVFDMVGPMDPTVQPAEDLDWFIRARERSVPTLILDETTLWYRWHSGSLTSGADPIRRRMLVALKRSLDRRRAGAPGSIPSLHGREWLPTTAPGTRDA